jgi:transcriptional regulator with XRE-family HTH domain
MSAVGDKLKTLREEHGISLEEIAGRTRIGRDYLEALETGRYESLPGPAFGKFYIRAYAEKIGFDPDPLLKEYELELRDWRGAGEEVRERGPRPERRVGTAIAAWRADLIARRERELALQGPEPMAEAAEPTAETAEPVVEVTEPVVEAVEPEALPAHVDEPPVPARAMPGRPARAWGPGLAAAIVLAVLILIGTTLTRTERTDAARLDASVGAAPVATGVIDTATRPDVLAAESETTPAPEPAPAAAEPRASPPAGSLSVTEHGVGRRVVANRLRDESDRFREGEVIAFQTRVIGGQRGDVVRHVWLRGGRLQQSIRLPLGGPNWRTHSTKTLWGTGQWTVEARDGDGQVLARDQFVVE